jgi:16S rRNA (uracil1498-N3)-methyltransferase
MVLAPLDFGDWLDMSGICRRLILVPGAETPLAGVRLNAQVQLVVGPEGGLSDLELELARSHGVEAVSLGPRVLRTETAAPAAVAVLQALAGDLA